MSRAPFQVLVIPYRLIANGYLYALFRRADFDGRYWQAIAGGGEDSETPLEAARRETFEEAGLSVDSHFLPLAAVSTIPVVHVAGFKWGPDILVIPEHTFGVSVDTAEITISREHVEYRWLPYSEACDILQWDSNRSALWELNYRLTGE